MKLVIFKDFQRNRWKKGLLRKYLIRRDLANYSVNESLHVCSFHYREAISLLPIISQHFQCQSAPYSTSPHQALLFYQQSPILTGQIIKPFTLKQNQSTKLPILTPLRVPRKDSASGAYWLEKSRGCLIWELECDFDIPGMNDLGVCVSNLTIHWSEQEKRINFSRIVFLKNPTRFYFSNQFYNSLNSQHSDSLQAWPC